MHETTRSAYKYVLPLPFFDTCSPTRSGSAMDWQSHVTLQSLGVACGYKRSIRVLEVPIARPSSPSDALQITHDASKSYHLPLRHAWLSDNLLHHPDLPPTSSPTSASSSGEVCGYWIHSIRVLNSVVYSGPYYCNGDTSTSISLCHTRRMVLTGAQMRP
jgi:hypothetical protein